MTPDRDGLTVTSDLVGDTVVLTLAGDLDVATVRTAREAIAGARADAPRGVVVDLRHLDFLDSTAIHLCADLGHPAGPGRRAVAFVAGAEARRVFDLVGMTESLHLVDPLEPA